jgi:hypothetical protein
MPRRRLYTYAELQEARQETAQEAAQEALRQTMKALNRLNRSWKTFTKRLIKGNHDEHTQERRRMMDAWLDAESRLHHRRKRSTDTIEQDAAIAEMRDRQRKKWAVIAEHFGFHHTSSAIRAYQRHRERTST